jgi:hypothetical protein
MSKNKVLHTLRNSYFGRKIRNIIFQTLKLLSVYPRFSSDDARGRGPEDGVRLHQQHGGRGRVEEVGRDAGRGAKVSVLNRVTGCFCHKIAKNVAKIIFSQIFM